MKGSLTPTRGHGNKKLEDRAFRIAVADSSRNGRKPFIRVSLVDCQHSCIVCKSVQIHIVLILDDLVVMEVHSNRECSKKSSVGGNCMSPGDPFARHRKPFVALLGLGRHRVDVNCWQIQLEGTDT